MVPRGTLSTPIGVAEYLTIIHRRALGVHRAWLLALLDRFGSRWIGAERPATSHRHPADQVRQRPGRRAVLRRLDQERRRQLDLVFGYFNRNWEQSLVIPSVRTPTTIRSSRVAAAIAVSRRSSCRGVKAGCIACACRANFGKQVMTLDDQGERQNREGVRRTAAGRRDHRADRHDARQPESRRRRSEQAAGRDHRSGQDATVAAGRRCRATVMDDGLPKPRVATADHGDATRR